MSVRKRQHVNPLGLGFETFRGAIPSLPAETIVECEIGCADAQFLFERARKDPSRRYVGIEIRETLADEVNERARSENLPVEAVFCNANHHLDKLFAPSRVSVVHVNFPDPWFKRRHKKRRMVDAALAAHIRKILAPNGQVFFQSDVWDIALDAMETFEGCEAWLSNEASPWTFWKHGNPFEARSWREANAEKIGLSIWRLLYRKPRSLRR